MNSRRKIPAQHIPLTRTFQKVQKWTFQKWKASWEITFYSFLKNLHLAYLSQHWNAFKQWDSYLHSRLIRNKPFFLYKMQILNIIRLNEYITRRHKMSRQHFSGKQNLVMYVDFITIIRMNFYAFHFTLQLVHLHLRKQRLVSKILAKTQKY